jgi:hypothetical protein
MADILLTSAQGGQFSMKSRKALFTVAALFVLGTSTGTRALGQQQPPSDAQQQHEQHHPGATAQQPATTSQPQANMMSMMARMKSNDAKLDELLKKMNAATGPAKTEAIAQLLTAIVEDRRNACEPMMANMMSMMEMMGGHGTSNQAPPPSRK